MENGLDDIQAAAAEPAAPPKRKKRRIFCAFCAVGLIAAVGIAAVCISPFGRYHYGLYAMKHEDYAAAERQFQALGSYKDAPSLCAEAGNMQLYLQAETYMDSGDYSAAYRAFRELGNFSDAPERKQEAAHMREVEKTYLSSESFFQEGLYDMAYQELKEIEDENYGGIPELREEILAALYEQLTAYVDRGEMLLALFRLRLLEAENYAPVDGLRERLKEEQHMELDTSYYDAISPEHITSFHSSTTTDDYATVIKYMYLTPASSMTLLPSGSRQSLDTTDNNLFAGLCLVDSWLLDYASVYNLDWWYEYDEYGNTTKIVLENTPGNAQSLDEAAQHIAGFQAYCEETVRMLNDELLITNSMSNQAKARVILDWVCSYLNYDQSLEIHDAFVAIENQIGVCECYAAIYNRMCNLAGIPTYGQLGHADGEWHIWSVQLDEAGNVFYTDATWSDRGFSEEGSTVSEFIDYSMALAHYLYMLNMGESAIYAPESISSLWMNYQYFWQEAVWDSHTPFADFEQIQASYQQNTNS